MAQFTQDELDKIYLRGFEPANGYDPLYFRYSHNQTFGMFTTEQVVTDVPYRLIPVGTVRELTNGLAPSIDEDLWVSVIPSASEITVPDAVKVHVHSYPVREQYDDLQVIEVYYIDEQGNRIPNNTCTIRGEYFAGSQPDEMLDTMCYLTLVYRTDVSQPEFIWGINYSLYYVPVGTTPVLGTDRAIKLGSYGTWTPNEPFNSWYNKNANSTWYDEKSGTPEMEGGGGGGSFFRPSIDIPVPPLPPFEICNSDFIKLYNITPAQLSDLGNFLWSSNFFDNIVKNWASPFENIISLSVVPLVSFDGTDVSSIQIGNVPAPVGGKRLNTSRYQVEMGQIDVNKIYNGFQDFAPFQKVKIFLPYIGVRDLDIDNFMGGSISVTYQVDVFTGSCVAHIVAHKNRKNYVVDSYNGNISMQIPVTGANYLGAFQASLNGLATMASGNVLGGVMQGMSMKPNYEKAGTLTGQNGRLGVKYPYLIFSTPKFKEPKFFRTQHGYKSNVTAVLGDCTGYNEVKYIDIDDLTALDTEKDEILNLLRTGVYI